MRTLRTLFENNRSWARRVEARDPGFFEKLSQQQTPRYLWIGCADSRVPANEIVGLLPGELFVHRNVANVVVHTDLNCLSVLQYAVEVLRVDHVIVCGHYGCGGVRSAFNRDSLGLIDNWLRHVQDIQDRHAALLAPLAQEDAINRLCELNVLEQARNICQTTIVRDAWSRQQTLSVHGWIYALRDGLLRDTGYTVSALDEVATEYERALATIATVPD